MKNPREIFIKLREVKYHYLIKFYKQFLKKIPVNCLYNHLYKFTAENGKEVEIYLCLLHQPHINLDSGIFPHLIDICQEPYHCINCNAFVFKHTKESIKEDFEEELKTAEPKIKAQKYPDICALEWVLDFSSTTIKDLNLFEKIKFWIKSHFYN